MLKITPESENTFKYSLPTNNIFNMIFYNLKDSNGATNIVINVVISNAIYIFLNIVRTKSMVAKRANVATIEKNIITINRRVKVKRKSIRDFASYISSNPIATATTNRQIVFFFLSFLHPDPAIRTTLSSFKTFLIVSAPSIVTVVIVRLSVL